MLAEQAKSPVVVFRQAVSTSSTKLYRSHIRLQNTVGKSATVSHTQENTRMITATKTLYLYVETPLHAGVGSGLSSIDLPIQRERTTQYPMIQGSGIKGKLRSVAEDMVERKIGTLTDEKVTIMFGPKTTGADHAGALIAGDARILLFPVRSLSGVFAYTTCYDVLGRFKRDRERSSNALPWHLPTPVSSEPPKPPVALVTSTSQISASGTIVLEEFSFQAQ